MTGGHFNGSAARHQQQRREAGWVRQPNQRRP